MEYERPLGRGWRRGSCGGAPRIWGRFRLRSLRRGWRGGERVFFRGESPYEAPPRCHPPRLNTYRVVGGASRLERGRLIDRINESPGGRRWKSTRVERDARVDRLGAGGNGWRLVLAGARERILLAGGRGAIIDRSWRYGGDREEAGGRRGEEGGDEGDEVRVVPVVGGLAGPYIKEGGRGGRAFEAEGGWWKIF